MLPFFAQSSTANITASGTSIDLAKKLANVNDLDMLTSWKANSANSSLTLSTGSPLTSINGLVLVYPRGTHNIKKIRIYAVNPSTNSETLINTLNEVGDDNSIFEIEGELLTSKIRVEFESTAGKTAEVAEALLIYDDPFKIFKQKLSQIKAIDKVKIQPPPVFGNQIGKQR